MTKFNVNGAHGEAPAYFAGNHGRYETKNKTEARGVLHFVPFLR